MADDTGGSFLAEAAASGVDGTPAEGAAPAPAPGQTGDQAAVREAIDGPPEWAPKKYWDPDKKSVKAEDLGRAYINLEKLLGREKVPVPSDDDDRDGWDRWYKASGRPDKPEEYDFKAPELPKDLPYDDDSEKNFRTWAHVNGLSKKQASSLYDGYVKHQVERHGSWHEAQQKQRGELEAALQREHGNNLDGVKQRAGHVMRDYADPDFHKFLNESGLGNDPRLIRVFDRIGKKLSGEAKLQGKVQAEAQPGDYQKAIADYREKHAEALHNRDHPNHSLRVKEFNKLFEGAYGTGPANRFA